MSLAHERVAHAVKYLRAHRKDFTPDFANFYGAHNCESLVIRTQDALTRVGEELLGTTPIDWTFEFVESLASSGTKFGAVTNTACSYLLVFKCRDGSLAAYGGCTHVGLESM